MKDEAGEGIAFILPPSSFSLIFLGVAYGRAVVNQDRGPQTVCERPQETPFVTAP